MNYYINMLTISNINNILEFSFKDDKNTRGIYKMIINLFEDNDIFESDSIISVSYTHLTLPTILLV